MVTLDIQITGNLFQSAENFQFVGLHGRYFRTDAVIFVDLLKSLEGLIQDRDGTLDYGTVFKRGDVQIVHHRNAFARLRAGTIAGNTFSIQSLYSDYSKSRAYRKNYLKNKLKILWRRKCVRRAIFRNVELPTVSLCDLSGVILHQK